ncbi:GTPase-activating protein, putative [Plasmodium gallinaceum]|uniref:GTPase-activating protein, putative n=1 Tax=Plasmodium gallinaceum TaxID=5849 RepID=A0A1J1GR44_PLAGA|nr:GTPase-activating protein, putative [Plasmodium gallinaceum]CRG94985.1 GTPase-activating protein, putative [Plasmodium gallinaceum]
MKDINENILNFVSDIRKIEIWKYIYEEKLKLFYLKKLIQNEMIITETSKMQKGECTKRKIDEKKKYIKKKNDDKDLVINITNVNKNKLSPFLNSFLYYDSDVNLRNDGIYSTIEGNLNKVINVNKYSLVKSSSNAYISNNSKNFSENIREPNDYKIVIDNNSINISKKNHRNDSISENKNTCLIGDSNNFHIFNKNIKNIYNESDDNIHDKMDIQNNIDKINIYNDNNIDSNNNKANNDNYKINTHSNKNDNSITIEDYNDEKCEFYNNVNYENKKCNKKENFLLFKNIYNDNKKDIKVNEDNLKKKSKYWKNLNQTNFNFNNFYEYYYDDKNDKNKKTNDLGFSNKNSNDRRTRKYLIKNDKGNDDYKNCNSDKVKIEKEPYKNVKCVYSIKKEKIETKNPNDKTQTKMNNKIHLNTSYDNYYVNSHITNLKKEDFKNIKMDKNFTNFYNLSSNNYIDELLTNSSNYIKNMFIMMPLEKKKKYYVEYNRKINSIIKDEVIKGIPDHIRGFAWQILVQSYMYKENNEIKRYEHYLSINNKYENTIKKDINRTYPKHILFKNNYEKGQKILFNVLKAYSNYNSDLGYCQGMAFIVATFILYMNEEDAFFMLISLLDKYKLNGLFSSNMPLLNEYLYILDQLLLFYFPKIHNHLQKENIHSSMYASQWFITLFSYNINILYAIRIWDFFFIHNYIFLFKVALAFFKLQEDIILTESFEDILNRLKILSKHVELDLLIKTALDINISNDLINKISSNYKLQK